MLRFLGRRLLFSAALVVLAASAALLLTRLAPGDLTAELASVPNPRQAAVARARYALDRTPVEQWRQWLASAVRLDFGESFLYQRPVGPLVIAAAGNTAVLAITALAIATVVGIGFGIVSGSRGGVGPNVVRAASMAAVSLPTLLTSLGLLFIAGRTGLFPVGGMSSLDAAASGGYWLDVARHLPLPALALALPIAGALERLQSAALAEQLHQPFVLAAAARGLPPRDLVLRHAWPVSIKAVAAIYGLAIGSLLSGSFAVELVTGWPGLGSVMYAALRARDIYLVTGCAAVGAALLSIGMLMGDLILAISDPRVREAQ
jgi:peptide/nickel transport system permease protein